MSLHGIKVVVNQTGLSAHVLRVWEKRYSAVQPQRTDTNRRMYTDGDIKRLQLLVKLTHAGYSIGQIAHLQEPELQGMEASTGKVTHIGASKKQNPPDYVPLCIEAIQAMDQQKLEAIFDEAIIELGYSGLIEQVVIPMIQRVGTDWHEGLLTTADEHAATSFIKDYLTQRVQSYSPEPNAPTILITTPAGQMHELGAFLASCIARKIGWNVLYLGTSLPADAIAGAAKRSNAAAILLSIVYPIDDKQIPEELRRLRKQIGDSLPILVGGDGTYTYDKALHDINAIVIETIPDLAPKLNELRKERAILRNG